MAKQTHAQKVSRAVEAVDLAMGALDKASLSLGGWGAVDKMVESVGIFGLDEVTKSMVARQEGNRTRMFFRFAKALDRLEKLALRADATKGRR